MVNGGGGWMILQSRSDGSVIFGNRKYSKSFGSFKNGGYWSGLHTLKNYCIRHKCEARIELEDWHGVRKYASYKAVSVGWEGSGFPLTISGYSGTAGDAMGYLNGATFRKCNGVSWWYKSCLDDKSNINGLYIIDNGTAVDRAMTWWTFHESYRPLKMSRFLFRPLHWKH